MDSIEDLHTAEQTQNTAEAHEKKEKKGFSFDKLRYKNMNIRARLLAGFSTILLFVLALGITNYIALSVIEDEMYIVNDRELALMKNYDNVNLAPLRKENL